jgi:hypothetical protein
MKDSNNTLGVSLTERQKNLIRMLVNPQIISCRNCQDEILEKRLKVYLQLSQQGKTDEQIVRSPMMVELEQSRKEYQTLMDEFRTIIELLQ